MTYWNGTTETWMELLDAVRRSGCEPCAKNTAGGLCREHHEMVTQDQRFLDHMLFMRNQRDKRGQHSSPKVRVRKAKETDGT